MFSYVIRRIHFGKEIPAFMLAVCGSFLYAIGLQSVLAANGLSEGGFAGLSALLYFLFGISMGFSYFFFNLPLFLFALWFFGKGFVARTLAGVILVSVHLFLTEPLAFVFEHPLLACLFAGAASGIGRGLMFRCGYTTGGVDIVSFAIHKWTGFPRAYTILAFDFIVMILFAVFIDPKRALYSFLALFIGSQFLHQMTKKYSALAPIQKGCPH